MQLFKGYMLVWVLLQDISDLIWLLQMVQCSCFLIYELCFTCFKVEHKTGHIFLKFVQ